jgi:hypothetical protein
MRQLILALRPVLSEEDVRKPFFMKMNKTIKTYNFAFLFIKVDTLIVIDFSLGLKNVNFSVVFANFTSSPPYTLNKDVKQSLESDLLKLWRSILSINAVEVRIHNVTNLNRSSPLNNETLFAVDHSLVLDPRIYPNLGFIFNLYQILNTSLYDRNLYNNLTRNSNVDTLKTVVPINLRTPQTQCNYLFITFLVFFNKLI